MSSRGHEAPVELSLTEYAVLGTVAEGRRHGFAVARLLGADGELGLIYTVARPAVYRAVERLAAAGLVVFLTVEPGDRGPRRTPLEVTARGSHLLEDWLWSPVAHVRELRTDFLLKVALIDRTGRDPSLLISAQIDVVEPIVAGIVQTHERSEGAERTISLWRARSAQAALQFLQELEAERSPRGKRSR